MPEVIALQSLFEGLFVRALQPEGAFKERLREKGFDVDQRRPRYPMSVWVDCVNVTAAELHPAVPLPQAWELVGDRFIDGYFRTLVGRMIANTLPFLSARTFVARSPRFITTGIEGAGLDFAWESDKSAVLRILGTGELAGHLLLGVSQNVYRRMKIEGVKLTARSLGGLDSEMRTTLP